MSTIILTNTTKLIHQDITTISHAIQEERISIIVIEIALNLET